MSKTPAPFSMQDFIEQEFARLCRDLPKDPDAIACWLWRAGYRDGDPLAEFLGRWYEMAMSLERGDVQVIVLPLSYGVDYDITIQHVPWDCDVEDAAACTLSLSYVHQMSLCAFYRRFEGGEYPFLGVDATGFFKSARLVRRSSTRHEAHAHRASPLFQRLRNRR